MNRVYRVVFNKALGCLQVASEHARSLTKSPGTHQCGATRAPDTPLPRLAPIAHALRRQALPLILAGAGLLASGTSWASQTIAISTSIVHITTSTASILLDPKIAVGTFTNSGTITGKTALLSTGGTIGTLVNQGTIGGTTAGILNTDHVTGTITIAGSIGTLTNTGVISGLGSSASGIRNFSGTISALTNSGTIFGRYSGIENNSGTIGALTNTGVISGESGIDNFQGTIGALTNSGLISGTSTNGIYNNSGTITALTNSGTISGNNSGIGNGSGSIGTLTNSGVITARKDSGIYNDAGTITALTNSGTISGYDWGIKNNSGTIGAITNSGVISSYTETGIGNDQGTIATLANSGLISGNHAGVSNTSGNNSTTIAGGSIGVLTNSGTITGYEYGVDNAHALIGTLTNSGVISGHQYSAIDNDAGTIAMLTNSGTIVSGKSAVDNNVGSIGTLTNSGLISSLKRSGIDNDFGHIGALTNTGTITADSDGIENGNGSIGTLTNSGLIASHTGYGIDNDVGTIGILTNTGTITVHGSSAIDNYRGSIGTLTNSGLIASQGGSGIDNYSGHIGVLTNTGTIAGGQRNGIDNGGNGTIGTLTNNGLISSRSSSGINNAFGSIGTLTNSGVITSQKYVGIYNDTGHIGVLTNSGTITGALDGLDNAGGTIGTLTNSGVISGKTVGIADTPAGTILGSIGAITNSGVISGHTGVELEGASTTLTNTGTIIGSGGTAITIAGNPEDLIFGTGSAIQGTIDAGTTASTFTLEGMPVFGDTIAAPDSTLTIAKTGDALASGAWTLSTVTNTGILAVGMGSPLAPTGGALTLTGAYTQASTGTLEVAGTDTGFSRLTVNGTATLAGTLLVNEGAGRYTVGDSYTIVKATTLSGTFAHTATLGDYFQARTTYGTAHHTVSLQVSALPAAYETGAAALDSAYADNQAIHAGLDAALDGSEGVLGRRGMRFTAAHVGAWVKGIGAFGQVSGANVQDYGAMMGYGDALTRHLVVGGAFSGIDTQTRAASQQVHANLFTAYGYGIDTLGHLRLSASLGAGRIGLNEDRTMAPLPVTAQGATHGWLLGAGLQAQYLVPMGRAFLIPYARLDYQHTRTSGFSEHGAGALDMHYQGQQTNLGLFTGGLRAGFDVRARGLTWVPWAAIGATGYAGHRNPTVLQTFGVDTNATVAHIAPADTFDAGAGVTVGNGGPWTAKLAYSGQYNGGTHFNTFSLLADYRW